MTHKHNCLFVILGATGDLTRKKIIPALYNIIVHKELKDFAVIGVSRDGIDVDELLEKSKKHIKNLRKDVWNELRRRFYHHKADFYDDKKFKELASLAKDIEAKHKLSGNRIFYLATLPQHFDTIAHNLSKHKLAVQNKSKKTWNRVVFEKPFGDDLKSAKKLNRCLSKVFKENQVYRIDHYLGKELVQNLSVLRFTNLVLEPIWTNKHIDHVQVIMSENFGVEGRGGFYDKYGVLKDVVQNHIMQLIALIAMEKPAKLDEKNIRNQKVKILKSIRKIDKKNVVLGQYADYTKEKGVKKNSKTETFAALKLFIDNPRWKGVPFYIFTGKNMPKKLASIYIQFKNAECLMFKKVCNFNPNHLVIQIQPDEGFYLQLNAKTPRSTNIVPVKMDFCHKCLFDHNTPKAYETLLLDVIHGDQSVFIRSDEIEEEWNIIDPLEKNRPKVHIYKKGKVPKQAENLIQKDNRFWHLTTR